MTDYQGFLTPTDKLFLRGEKQYQSKQGRYDRRESIRNRTREALYDFGLLESELDESEMHKIFNPPENEVDDLMQAFVDTIAFLYHAAEGGAGSQDRIRRRSFRYPFDQLLRMGVRTGELNRRDKHERPGPSHHVTVEFSVDWIEREPVDRDFVIEDLAETGGARLSETELREVIGWAIRRTVTDDPPQHSKTGLRGLAEAIEEKSEESE